MRTLFFLLAIISIPAFFVVAGTVERASVNDLGVQANNDSSYVRITPDGRYVVFASTATNLIAGDTGTSDIFVFDRNTEEIERVSVHTDGTPGNGASIDPSISTDGRYVAFNSSATNLVAGDVEGFSDVFVHDRQTGVTERVSVHTDGTAGDDGVFSNLEISGDGVYVTFGSEATNLVDDDANGAADVFVHNRETGVTERVSVDSDELEGSAVSLEPAISTDGRYVAFATQSSLHADDLNVFQDIYVRDRTLGTTELVSKTIAGDQDNISYNPAISGDGRYIAFASDATNLVAGDIEGQSDIFVFDRNTEEIERVSVNNDGEGGDGVSSEVSISPDGRYVSFYSDATNLVDGDTNGVSDVFIYDRNTDTIELVSKNSSDVIGNGASSTSSVSSDSRYTAFLSSATNLTADDTNGKIDVFIYDQEDESVENLSDASTIYGFQMPNVMIEGNPKRTNSRFVDLIVLAPYTITYYEISNNADFSNKEIYFREYTKRNLEWDLCKGSMGCVAGAKRIYVRFYNERGGMFEDYLSIEYKNDSCPYFKTYLRMKSNKNNPEEVMKMQEFLNNEIGSNLTVDGFFGEDTDRAVRRFQEKYSSQIIRPWPTLDHSTGWWYITTSAYANILVGC